MADYAGAVEAIETRLSTQWLTTPIAFENEAAPAVIDGDGNTVPWVFCEIVSTDAQLASVGKPGAHTVRDEGLIRVIVFIPFQTGRALARQYAVTIGEIFRTKEFYTETPGACVRCWSPRIDPGNLATSENPSGNWWAMTVTIPFHFIRFA